jgi:hypothetical protein
MAESIFSKYIPGYATCGMCPEDEQCDTCKAKRLREQAQVLEEWSAAKADARAATFTAEARKVREAQHQLSCTMGATGVFQTRKERMAIDAWNELMFAELWRTSD